MPDWLSPELVEQAAQALQACPKYVQIEDDDALVQARAVLEAVGPAIYAAGYSDGSFEDQYGEGFAERGRLDKASIEAIRVRGDSGDLAVALAAINAHDKEA